MLACLSWPRFRKGVVLELRFSCVFLGTKCCVRRGEFSVLSSSVPDSPFCVAVELFRC